MIRIVIVQIGNKVNIDFFRDEYLRKQRKMVSIAML